MFSGSSCKNRALVEFMKPKKSTTEAVPGIPSRPIHNVRGRHPHDRSACAEAHVGHAVLPVSICQGARSSKHGAHTSNLSTGRLAGKNTPSSPETGGWFWALVALMSSGTMYCPNWSDLNRIDPTRQSWIKARRKKCCKHTPCTRHAPQASKCPSGALRHDSGDLRKHVEPAPE